MIIFIAWRFAFRPEGMLTFMANCLDHNKTLQEENERLKMENVGLVKMLEEARNLALANVHTH